jgi:tetratricopeptide (TPR) repeat protein
LKGEKTNSGKFFYFCLAVLILGLASCSREIKTEKQVTQIKETKFISMCRHSRFISALSGTADFDAALKENREILSHSPRDPAADEALFNIGIIYAFNKNPGKDYKKSLDAFRRLAKEFPKSRLAAEAQVWIGVLEDIEKALRVDIEIQEQKKGFK